MLQQLDTSDLISCMAKKAPTKEGYLIPVPDVKSAPFTRADFVLTAYVLARRGKGEVPRGWSEAHLHDLSIVVQQEATESCKKVTEDFGDRYDIPEYEITHDPTTMKGILKFLAPRFERLDRF